MILPDVIRGIQNTALSEE